MRRLATLVLTSLLLFDGSEQAYAQSAQSQHLVQAGNVVYLGKFTLPSTDGTGRTTAESALTWGGFALGIGPDGQSLYYGCHEHGARLARVTIPAIGGSGAVVEPCSAIANLSGINPGDPNGQRLGGSLAWNGRLLVTGYATYDGSGTSLASHFVGPNTTSLAGPFRVGTDKVGVVAGYMGVVPIEWRALLGGSGLTGQCCLSVLARTSFGPSVSVFQPDQVGVGAAPSQMLVGYPEAHQTLGPWDQPNPYFSGAAKLGGVAFPAGTRSVLFVGRHGSTFCYGLGTSNPALHNQPTGQGGVYCFDPTDDSKGNHGYPYFHQVWAYDANDLLAVKQGQKQPWDVVPYGSWRLTEMDGGSGSASIRSATYDPATRRWYIVQDTGGGEPKVHVYEITNAVLQPPRTGPVNFSVRNDPGAWTFSWLPPLQAGWTAYTLEGGSAPGLSDVGTILLPPGTTSLAVPSAPGSYFVRLRALYPDGGHAASSELHVGNGAAGSTPAPTNFRGAVNGSTVVLTWESAVGAAVSHVWLDAGTGPGGTDIVSGVDVGVTGSFVAAGVASGRYFMRLRAAGAGGTSAVSNEVEVVVGGATLNAPLPPRAFSATLGPDRTVTTTWAPPEEGAAPTGYFLDAGSAPGQSDLVAGLPLPIGDRFSVSAVPPGVYYLRMRSFNAAGSSASTAEVRLVVE